MRSVEDNRSSNSELGQPPEMGQARVGQLRAANWRKTSQRAQTADGRHHGVGIVGPEHHHLHIAEVVRPEPGDEPLRPQWLAARVRLDRSRRLGRRSPPSRSTPSPSLAGSPRPRRAAPAHGGPTSPSHPPRARPPASTPARSSAFEWVASRSPQARPSASPTSGNSMRATGCRQRPADGHRRTRAPEARHRSQASARRSLGLMVRETLGGGVRCPCPRDPGA